MHCRVCGHQTTPHFEALVLNQYQVTYYLCPVCDFMQTEEPYWLDEAYSNPINLSDTGILQRNLILARSAATLIFFCFDRNAKFLDYAGGYGTMARVMRDIGFDYYTTDPFTPNVMARGFDTIPADIELVTAFECFEHFAEPMAELTKILAYSRNIFFTTQPRPSPTPALADWWYYAPHHGQHVAFYTAKTFRFMAKQHGLTYYSILNYHLFTPKRLAGWWYSFLVAAGRLGLAGLVKLMMKSRTLSDQVELNNQPHGKIAAP